MSDTLPLGDLALAGRRSAHRKSLGLTVKRDGSLVVSAALGVPAGVH
jgi:hypothetical protein